MNENWREYAAQRELDDVRNCKRCEHYLPNEGGVPACLKWSKIQGSVVSIGIGYSGTRNNAPFCQFFEVKERHN